jgi:hypothetical protein
MKRLEINLIMWVSTSALILFSATVAFTQKKSDRQDYELIGKVKVLRSWTISYKFVDGKFSEKESSTSEPVAVVFDRDGNMLFKAIGLKGLMGIGEVYASYSYRPYRLYDQEGNLAEYLSADTLEHSSYRIKYTRDSKGKIVRSEEYDPYKLTSVSVYNYDSLDDRGNWTTRTITPERPVSGRSWKTMEMRNIEYY